MGKKLSKTTKNSVCCICYLRNHTSYDCNLWYACVKWYISRSFFQFFKILLFRVFSGVKWQKTVQNDKNFCVSSFISQEPYVIWFPFTVHSNKMIISLVFLHFFKVLIFWFVRRVKRQKNSPKNSVMLCISGTIHDWLSFMIHMCKIIIFPGVFFQFFKILIFWMLGG